MNKDEIEQSESKSRTRVCVTLSLAIKVLRRLGKKVVILGYVMCVMGPTITKRRNNRYPTSLTLSLGYSLDVRKSDGIDQTEYFVSDKYSLS